MKKQSKLKIENLEAIASPSMQELTSEEADKIVGGTGKYNPGNPGKPSHPQHPCYPTILP